MTLTLVRFGDDKKPLSPLPEKSLKRLNYLRGGYYSAKSFTPLAAVEDARGRGAIAYTKVDHKGESHTEMALYEGGSIRSPIMRKPYSPTMHGALDLLARFEEHLEGIKALKQSPHPFKVGDVLVSTYGYNMLRATFYQVVEVPTPRKIAIVKLPLAYETGDHHSGTVVPVVPPDGALAAGPRTVYTVSMAKGRPALVGYDRYTSSPSVWDGKPIHTHSD